MGKSRLPDLFIEFAPTGTPPEKKLLGEVTA